MNSDIAAEFDAQLENLSEQDQSKLLAMKETILGIGNAAENSGARLSKLKDGLDLLQTALQESVNGTGLTTESIDALIARYESLAGFDAAKLFERTANGIHINKDAFDLYYLAITSLNYEEKIANNNMYVIWQQIEK